jgi:hypothetical protein
LQSGQVAVNSRLALDQNVKVEAGMGSRQYTHGTIGAS